MKKILEELMIYGWDEYIILAGLCGFPVLLWGDPGTGKTKNLYNLLKNLGYKTLLHDASKAQWEDLLGFPIPKDGKIEYFITPHSLWNGNAWIIDEINRAPVQTQNWLLEIIREKKVMGISVPIEIIFAACNILEIGTNEMDRALLSRFIGTKVPGFKELKKKALKLLCNVIDGVEESYDTSELKKIVDSIKIEFQFKINKVNKALVKFLYKFGHLLDTSDTRKLLVLKNIIILYFTAKNVLKDDISNIKLLEKAVIHTYGPYLLQDLISEEQLIAAMYGAKNILDDEFEKYFVSPLNSVVKRGGSNALWELENLEKLRKTPEGTLLLFLLQMFPELKNKVIVRDMSILKSDLKNGWEIKSDIKFDKNDPFEVVAAFYLWSKGLPAELLYRYKAKAKNIYDYIMSE